MQKTTLFLILFALGLGGYVYWYEIQPQSQQETVTESEEGLFSFSEEEVQRLKIQRQGRETIELIRLETIDSSWRMKQPEGTPGEEASIVFLLDLLVKENNSKTFTVETEQLDNYGLTTPFATITVELANNTEHQIFLGNPTFDEEDIYAQINPEEGEETEVYILPIDFQYAVERPLSEWKLTFSSGEEETTETENESTASPLEEETTETEEKQE